MGWQRPPFFAAALGIYKTILPNCLVGQCTHDTRRLTLYILTNQVKITSPEYVGNKPRRETPIGQLGCDLSDRHSLQRPSFFKIFVGIYKTAAAKC